MNDKEIWKDIPGYEGSYQISSFGNIKSLERIVKRNGHSLRIKPKIISKCIDKTGYYHAGLWSNNKRKEVKLHKLVAIVFLGHNPSGYDKIIDHINNNPLDNRVENLRIVSCRQNSSNHKKTYSSKYVGVHWHKKHKKWNANILIGSKRKYLGSFNNEYDAHLAYQKALSKL